MKIFVIFPKDSEALFNKKSNRTFGGASVQMYNIVKELSKYKEIKTFSIISAYNNINFDDHYNFDLVKIYNENDNGISKSFKFIKYAKKLKPDIVIQRGLTLQSCLLALVCWLLKIKFIFMFAHDVEVNGLRQADQSKVLLFFLLRKFAHIIITQNKYQKETLLKKYRCDSVIIYNGFEIKNDIQKQNKRNYILWVARCDNWKQPELFIELAIKNQHLQFCMICPKSNDEKYYGIIKNKALQVKNLHFIEFVPYNEIDVYFKNAFLFINTSLYEGFPQTFIQATMNAVPIVSFHVNPEDFLNVYECGYGCNGNFEVLTNKINELWKDNQKYKTLSDNAYTYAYNNHNIAINVKKLIQLFGHVLNYRNVNNSSIDHT